jgi:dTDP-4-amino-4,6-dideoxygalactose transaminase
MNNCRWKITLSDISISQKEEAAVLKILRSRWFTMGETTKRFENEFKELHKAKHAIAVTNCTAGLHLANLALGIGTKEEVICPSLTFVATANSILYAGARPVFADIISQTNLNISPKDIERKINKKTKAIIVVHYGGYPCDMKKINNIAQKHRLAVIEDCAHAPLVKYKNKYLGTFGDIGVFSFFSNKNMTTAEGGMILTNNDNLAAKMRSLRSHGMTSLTLDRHKGHAYSYDVLDLGFNFRIDEIRSALGLAQLKRVAIFNKKRNLLTAYYRELFRDIPEIRVAFSDYDLEESSCHIFPVLVKNNAIRNGLQAFLKSAGIQTSIHYPPVHQFSYYRHRFGRMNLPITESVASRILTLPLFPTLTKAKVNFIINKIKGYFSKTAVSVKGR